MLFRQPIMQGGREQQRLVHIRGSKALSHGRILSPNTLWKSCHVWCFRRIYSRQTPSKDHLSNSADEVSSHRCPFTGTAGYTAAFATKVSANSLEFNTLSPRQSGRWCAQLVGERSNIACLLRWRDRDEK